MASVSRHNTLLPEGAPDTAPEWLQLVPAGVFRGFDGRGPFVVRNAARLIAASMAGGKLPIDENHATDIAAPEGQPSPARGWIVELQARADGIWGRVEWNDSGKQLLADRAYRGISPVFAADEKTGEVLQVMRAALTNTPNLKQLATLHHQENHVDLKTLREALGLAENTADSAVIDGAVARITAHSAELGRIREAAGLKDGDAGAVVTHLNAQRAAAGDVQKMAATVVQLQTQLDTLRAEGAKARAVAFVDGAITAGKPIAALRDHYIARHMADAAAVEKEIGALVSIHAAGGKRAPMKNAENEPDGDEAMSEEDMAVCRKMGLDPKAFRENRKKMAAMKEGR